MNDELRFISTIRQALDESTERLSAQLADRLEQAREAALTRLPAAESPRTDAAGPVPPGVADAAGDMREGTAGNSYLLPNGRLWLAARKSLVPDFPRAEHRRPGLAYRFAVIAVPLVVVVSGLIGFSELASERSADEVAELEAAVLADEIPISAYADRGFGAYLKTTYQPEQ